MSKREFKTGANRNSSNGKFVYSDFINPLNEHSFAKYMHGKRFLDDGTYRDGNNWQRGIPMEELLKSFRRHSWELEALHLGYVLVRYTDEEGEHTEVFHNKEGLQEFVNEMDVLDIKWEFVNIEDVLNAIRFNTEAYKLQVIGYKLED